MLPNDFDLDRAGPADIAMEERQYNAERETV